MSFRLIPGAIVAIVLAVISTSHHATAQEAVVVQPDDAPPVVVVQPAPVQLADPVLPYEQLDDWGVKCYEYLEDRAKRVPSPAGVVTTFQPSRVAVVLTSTWRDDGQIHILDDWPVRRHTRRLQERIYANEDPHLSVNRVHMVTLQHHIYGVRENDVLKYEIDGAPGSEPMPSPTLTVGTLMRIVTMLPYETGREYDARQIMNLPKLELSDASLPIVCQGPETIWLRGLEQDTTKLTYNGYTAWVRNSDRVLLRLQMPSRQYLELLKDGNCCSAERLRKFVDRIREDQGVDDAAAPAAVTPATPEPVPSPF